MRPKRYPFSGKIKTSAAEAVEVWEYAYSIFNDKTQKKQEQAEQKLRETIRRFRQACL